MPFIRAVRVAEPGTSNEHVEAVQVSLVTTGTVHVKTRESVHAELRRGERYRTFNDHTHQQADVVPRVSPRGTRYIATVANGVETDNLLRLPRF